MSGWIKLRGSTSYTFDAPHVTLWIQKLQNTDSSSSGQILVQLWNTQYSDGSGDYQLIADFLLPKLEANTYYYDISRCLDMKNDLTLPYLQIIVYEKYTDGWKWSDNRKFAKITRTVKRKNAFRISTIKNGVKTLAKATGLIGTIGGIFFPPLAAVGVIGNAIGSFLDD